MICRRSSSEVTGIAEILIHPSVSKYFLSRVFGLVIRTPPEPKESRDKNRILEFSTSTCTQGVFWVRLVSIFWAFPPFPRPLMMSRNLAIFFIYGSHYAMQICRRPPHTVTKFQYTIF